MVTGDVRAGLRPIIISRSITSFPAPGSARALAGVFLITSFPMPGSARALAWVFPAEIINLRKSLKSSDFSLHIVDVTNMTLCAKCLSGQAKNVVPTAGSLCDSCFVGLVERRVKKSVRQDHPFVKNERVLVVDDGSLKAGVMQALLSLCLGGLPLRVTQKRGEVESLTPEDMTDFDKVLLPLDGDDVASGFLGWLLKGEETQQIGIPFLSCLLDEEVEVYARIKGIPGDQSRERKGMVNEVKSLERQYPGLTHGLLKSSKGFRSAAQGVRVSQGKD